MDFLSHGLWGALSAYPKYKKEPKKLLAALGVGMLPDVISFLPVQVYFVFTGFRFSPDLFFPVPQHWVFSWAIQSYNFTHSLVICLLTMGIVWAVRKRFPLLLLPWLLHILLDIPTHPDFFQTPLFFPISSWRFPWAISWANPYIFFSNWILLISFMVGIYMSRKKDIKKNRFMKSVVLCGSGRFKEEIRKFARELKGMGVVVFEPHLSRGAKDWEIISQEFKNYAALGLTLDHFQKIRIADVVFIYNKDGYAGNSTTLEIGYAVALGKVIYSLEPDEEICRNVLFKEQVPTPAELFKLL